MGEICGAVEWIDDPKIGRWGSFDLPALFSQESVVWELFADVIDDALFSRVVCIGHKIDPILVLNAKS